MFGNCASFRFYFIFCSAVCAGETLLKRNIPVFNNERAREDLFPPIPQRNSNGDVLRRRPADILYQFSEFGKYNWGEKTGSFPAFGGRRGYT